MRSCAVCFFFRPGPDDGGECMVDPPVPVLADLADAGGRVEATFVSVRPEVGSQDFCSRFSHRAGPKKRSDDDDAGLS